MSGLQIYETNPTSCLFSITDSLTVVNSILASEGRSNIANGDLGSPSPAVLRPVGHPPAQRFTDRGQHAIMRSHHFVLA